MDGKRIEFQAKNRFVPDEWLKLTFINRPILDQTNPNQDDNNFWISSVSYNPDITRLKKLVSKDKGVYVLV